MLDELIQDPRAELRERGLEHWTRAEADRRFVELIGEYMTVDGVEDPVNALTRAMNVAADILYTERFAIDLSGLNVHRLMELYGETGRPMRRSRLPWWCDEVARSLANHWRAPCTRERLEMELDNRGVHIRDSDVVRLLVRRINAAHPELPLILVVPSHIAYKPLFVTRQGYEDRVPHDAVIPLLRLLDG